MTAAKTIAGQASFIGLTALGGAIVGFTLQLVLAYYFGAGRETDAFFMASSTSELLTKLLMGGSITAVFIPMFVHYIANSKTQQAWRLALNILHITTIIFAGLLLVVALGARPFVDFIAPGFDSETKLLTTSLLYVLLPSFLLLFVVDLLVAMLHALQRFTIPALLRLISPAISVLSVLLLQRHLGIFSLAVGVVVGATLQFLLVGGSLRRLGLIYQRQLSFKDPDFHRLVHLLYPFLLSTIATLLAGIIYRVLVSELSAGSLSALKYAEKITQLLTIVFINSVTIVMYPRLAEAASRGNFEAVTTSLAYAVRLTLLLTVPLWIGASMLREPIIQFIYQHGSFSPEAAALTSSALLFLSLSLCTNTVSSLLGHAILALQRTRAAVAVTIASQGVAICLFVILVPRLEHAGLALASSLVPLSAAALYYIHLNNLLPNLWRIIWQSSLFKIAALGVVLAGFLWLWQQYIPDTQSALWRGVVHLFIPVVLGATTFFGLAFFWRIAEVHDLAQVVLQKISRRSPA